jgi:DNA-binding Lrp family transcriptional regulator
MHLPDAIDLALIRATQAGLPLTAQPYSRLAEQLNISSQEVMDRLQTMLDCGIIRRLGVVPNHYSLGYRFNGMSVWNVPDDKIDDLGSRIGRLEFVSHCYHRPRHLPVWPFNLFAMIHAKSRDDADRQIEIIADILGEANHGSDILFSSRILKKTGFQSRRANQPMAGA